MVSVTSAHAIRVEKLAFDRQEVTDGFFRGVTLEPGLRTG